VVVFPRARGSRPGERGKYNIGGAMLAERSGYPIVPIAHNAGVSGGGERCEVSGTIDWSSVHSSRPRVAARRRSSRTSRTGSSRQSLRCRRRGLGCAGRAVAGGNHVITGRDLDRPLVCGPGIALEASPLVVPSGLCAGRLPSELEISRRARFAR